MSKKPFKIKNGLDLSGDFEFSSSLTIKETDGFTYAVTSGQQLYLYGNNNVRLMLWNDNVRSYVPHDAYGLGNYSYGSSRQHLILTSSAGSTVHVSGNLEVDEKISNSNTGESLIISGSSGDVAMSGNLWVRGSSDIARIGTHGSSLGLYIDGQTKLSIEGSSVNLAVNTKMSPSRKLYAEEHLILSSSGGSVVHISGALEVDENISGGGQRRMLWSGQSTYLYGNDNLRMTLWNDSVNTTVPVVIGSTNPYSLNNSSGHLILSNSAGSTITSSGSLRIEGGTSSVLLPRLTTTERNALTTENGMIIYNTTTAKFEGYEAGAWVSLI